MKSGFCTKIISGVFIKVIPFIILLIALFSCRGSQEKHFVELTNKIDPDIVLINIGEVDRAVIGRLLLSINSCHPSVIGIDAWFSKEKDHLEDSVLMAALDTIQNDVLGYHIDSGGIVVKSNTKFSALAKDEGLTNVEQINGLLSAIKPIQVVDKKTHEAFALKIIEQWKPEFKNSLKPDQKVPIKYRQTLDQFFHFDHSEINDVGCEVLRNKVVLIGYLGPSNEDKHFTPIRLAKKYDNNDPDTYGLVVIANAIRTILDHGN